MSVLVLLAVLAALALAGYLVCRQRAVGSADGKVRDLHSLPHYYGWNGAIMTLLPGLTGMILWLLIQPFVIEARIAGNLPAEYLADDSKLELTMSEVRRVAGGLDQAVSQGAMTETEADTIRTEFTDVRDKLARVGVALGSNVTKEVLAAAQEYRQLASMGSIGRAVLCIALALGGLALAWFWTSKTFRARNQVERFMLGLLMAASSVAILTTIGIVYSMLSETINFFRQYPFQDFFFSATWSPNFRGDSELGILPLIWGTMYISLVSMIVSVPIGLFAAIYTAEYASKKTRNIVKPILEMIAGIPTVVFGLFALVTVGPLLRDWFAQPLGLGESGSSVMTAGIVIGIMNIPFISSLSDDIITAVPQSMRDGSLGLGATRSETIRKVVLPAALPGIVGAILMAASRAIGETMIVVMGAGAAAKLSLNPFEAMTTMTVKIVGQLTGDTDFAAPETLVAFALGMTLFVITLALNIVALWVVRKYREQYE
jgi:phosphate transport system permease protein